MKHQRVVVTRYGGPDLLEVIEEPIPEPRPGEVRVRVLAAGVSLPDVMAREGIHPETRAGGVSAARPQRLSAACPPSISTWPAVTIGR